MSVRIPLTSDGWREMLAATVVLGPATVALVYWFWPLAVLPVVIWTWAISFFRDPHRLVPDEPNVLVSPADGTVTHVTELDHDDDVGGSALRISIFLSIFSVHINRCPCPARVRAVSYRKGEFVNAMSPDSSHRNEANTVVFDGLSWAPSTVVVRQIAGLIARRIICRAKAGDTYDTGQRFGMIKFGSRTELTIPRHPGDRVVVEVGQYAYAGKTVLVRLAPNRNEKEA